MRAPGGRRGRPIPPPKEPEFPDVLEWHHDEKRFVDVVLKTVVGKATTKQPPGAKRAMGIGDLALTDEAPPPAFGSYAVHLMPEYRECQVRLRRFNV